MKKTGRPLSFDRNDALDAAMLVFWRYGYEATSINDLTAAMKINPPSLYGAFGDKKTLFIECVRLYVGLPPAFENSAENSYRTLIFNLLKASAERFTGIKTPAGCFLGTSTQGCAEASKDVQKYVADIRIDFELKLQAMLRKSVERGELPDATNVSALAGTIMAVMQGMSTLARDGANQEKLMDIVYFTMDNFFPK